MDYEKNYSTICEALPNIPADDYDIYLKVCAALKHEAIVGNITDEDARVAAMGWASMSNKFDENEFNKKWNSLKDENIGNKANAGTIINLAKKYGYNPKATPRLPVATNLKALNLDETINIEDIEEPTPATYDINAQRADVFAFLALFQPDEKVGIVFDAEYNEEKKKWNPAGRGVVKSVDEWKKVINTSVEKTGLLFGAIRTELDKDGKKVSYNHEAGVWARINPLDGGASDKNVTSFRYALIESDTLSKEEQVTTIKRLNLPYALLTDSGNKSIHAIVRVDAKDPHDYALKVRYLYDTCNAAGLQCDVNVSNPSRLTRLPGIERAGRFQCVIERPRPSDIRPFEEWRALLSMGSPIDIAAGWDAWDPEKELAAELIEGVLRKGHKMILAAKSKAGKSFALIELAAALASGGNWLGFHCRKSKVLYLNLEIDPASFINRIHKVYTAMGLRPENGMFEVWNLRGKYFDLETFASHVIVYAARLNYDAIIIDPIYKLNLGGDENKAGDVGKLCAMFDELASSLNASIIYSHHFSKGGDYSKAQMDVIDRMSGSGVFARDADAMITLYQVEDPNPDPHDHPFRTAWKLESILREFQPQKPKVIYFDYPLHFPVDIDPDEVNAKGDPTVKGGQARAEDMAAETEDRKRLLGEYLTRVFTTHQGAHLYTDESKESDWGISLIDCAAVLGVGVKTLRRYVAKMEGYKIFNSIIFKAK